MFRDIQCAIYMPKTQIMQRASYGNPAEKVTRPLALEDLTEEDDIVQKPPLLHFKAAEISDVRGDVCKAWYRSDKSYTQILNSLQPLVVSLCNARAINQVSIVEER